MGKFPGGKSGATPAGEAPAKRMTPHLGGSRIIEAARGPVMAIAVTCGIALYLAYHVAQFRFSSVWPPALRNDAGIDYRVTQIIFQTGAYPTDTIFPFSPSGVLIFCALGIAGPTVFMAMWYVLMVSGLVVTLRAALAQEGHGIRDSWLLIGAVAILCADAPVSWDLRNANSNLIYLGLVMAGYGLLGRLPVLAGTLIGLSVSLKLYSALLMVWLLANGPRRAAGAAVATFVILWAVLPVALFGTDQALTLYAGWIEQLKTVSDPTVHANLVAQDSPVPLVTLRKAVVNLSGGTFESAATVAWLSALWAIWTVGLAWYAWRCRGAFPVAVPSRAALVDWIVLLLAPLPFSPWLEPYHFVPLLVGALICTSIALDEKMARSDRMTVLLALAMLLLFIVVKVPFRVRGLGLGAQALVFVLALGFLRPRLRRQAEESTEEGRSVQCGSVARAED
jgi:hypothetical protein